MGGEFVGLALPGPTADTLQSAVGERIEVALDAASRDVGKAGDGFVVQPLALEPQDFHPLLDAWMRVMVTRVADGVEVFGSKGETAHGDFLCNGQPATHYAPQPRLAIVTDSYVSSISVVIMPLSTHITTNV